VLWIAYTWHPSSLSSAFSNQPTNPLYSQNFVDLLFDESFYTNFKYWLGEQELEDLKVKNMAGFFASDTIETVLDILSRAFFRNSF
jgi:hypothetical protein